MKINKELNLVIPHETEDGQTVYFHSAPIRRETFEMYFEVLGKVFSDIYAKGLHLVGPRCARTMIEKVSKEIGCWEGLTGVENGLLAEIRRLTNVILPTKTGWQNIPMADAIKKDLLDAEELSVIENYICFFIVASAVHTGMVKKAAIQNMVTMWELDATSLSCTEFRDSLPTSTEDESTGEKVKASSIPC